MRTGAGIVVLAVAVVLGSACGLVSAEAGTAVAARVAAPVAEAPPVQVFDPAPDPTTSPRPDPWPDEVEERRAERIRDEAARRLAEAAPSAARASGPLAVFAAPGAEEPEATLPPTTILGTPTVVLVRDHGPDGWLRVALPGRPNGREGWVRAGEVEQFPVQRRVLVDLSERRLVVLEDEEPLLETAVAVGSDASPTPVGSFFVTDAVEVTGPVGPWGRYAFGLSARSDTVTEFNGGDGIIGIHGTNRPESIGQAASLGCVRVPNETMAELWGLLGVGTPVEIQA